MFLVAVIAAICIRVAWLQVAELGVTLAFWTIGFALLQLPRTG